MSPIVATPAAATSTTAKMGTRVPGVVQTRRRSRTLPGSTKSAQSSDSEAQAANPYASIRNLPPSHPFANPLPPTSFTGSTPCLVPAEKASPSKMARTQGSRSLPQRDAGSPSSSRTDSSQITRAPAPSNHGSPWTPKRTPSLQVHSLSYKSTTPTPPPPPLSPPPPPRSAQRPRPPRLLSDGDSRVNARYGGRVMVKEIRSFSEHGHGSEPHEVMLPAQSDEYPGQSPVFSPPRPRQFPDSMMPEGSTPDRSTPERNTPPRSSSKTWSKSRGPLPRPPRAKASSPVEISPLPALETHPLLFRASSLSRQHPGSMAMSSPSSHQSHLSQVQPSIQSHTFADDLDSPLSRGESFSSQTRSLTTVEKATVKPSTPLKSASNELDVFSVPPAAKVVGDEPFDLFASPTAERIRKAADCKILDQLGNEFTFGSLLPQTVWPPNFGSPTPRVLVVFLRHYLCGLCQDYVMSVEKALNVKTLAAANVRLIFIGTGNYRVIKSYQKTLKSTVPYYVDPTPNNTLYRLLGMTLEAKFVQPRTPRPDYNTSGPRLQAARGFVKGLTQCPKGASSLRDWKQQGGEFLFGPGYMCEFAHRMHHMGDHWDPGFILQAAGVPYPSAAPPPLFDPCFNPGFIISNPVTRAKVDAYLSFHHYYKSKAVGRDRQPAAPLEREKLENLSMSPHPASPYTSRLPLSESSSSVTTSLAPGSYRSTSPFRSPRQPRFLTMDSPAGTWAREPVAAPHLTSCY